MLSHLCFSQIEQFDNLAIFVRRCRDYADRLWTVRTFSARREIREKAARFTRRKLPKRIFHLSSYSQGHFVKALNDLVHKYVILLLGKIATVCFSIEFLMLKGVTDSFTDSFRIPPLFGFYEIKWLLYKTINLIVGWGSNLTSQILTLTNELHGSRKHPTKPHIWLG